MQALLIIQRIMGATLTVGFFAHDIEFTEKLIGIRIVSIVFLTALFWFHVLVFLKEAKLAHINSLKHNQAVEQLRIIIAALSCVACLFDNFRNAKLAGIDYLSFENICVNAITILVLVFPEFIFKIIFVFEPPTKP